MEPSGFNERWQEIRTIWMAKENLWLYALVGFAAGALIVPFLLSESDVLANLFPEALGILFTVVVIDQLNERRAERLRREELILQMGSPDNAFAVEAARILRLKGWLRDGSLRNSHLKQANLERAYLVNAKLRGADLRHANLRYADLFGAELQGADLFGADLEGAFLADADLRGANLHEANLRGANRERAMYDEQTRLPDGCYWKQGVPTQEVNEGKVLNVPIPRWEAGTEMSRFTDPNHPNFWRSDHPLLPAYRGKGAQ